MQLKYPYNIIISIIQYHLWWIYMNSTIVSLYHPIHIPWNSMIYTTVAHEKHHQNTPIPSLSHENPLISISRPQTAAWWPQSRRPSTSCGRWLTSWSDDGIRLGMESTGIYVGRVMSWDTHWRWDYQWIMMDFIGMVVGYWVEDLGWSWMISEKLIDFRWNYDDKYGMSMGSIESNYVDVHIYNRDAANPRF